MAGTHIKRLKRIRYLKLDFDILFLLHITDQNQRRAEAKSHVGIIREPRLFPRPLDLIVMETFQFSYFDYLLKSLIPQMLPIIKGNT